MSVDTVVKAVNARMPPSVTPATRMEIHPSEWMKLTDEIERLRKRLTACERNLAEYSSTASYFAQYPRECGDE